jgi:hypothetical protein
MSVRPVFLVLALFTMSACLMADGKETKPAPATTEETELARVLTKQGQTVEVELGLAESARISVSVEKATDAKLLALCKQPMVGKLDLRDASKVTPEGFGYLKELPNLQTLLICQGDISPAEAMAISKLGSLTTLSLSGCKTTDIAVGNFKRMKDLVEIDLTGTKLSEKGIEPLLELKKLQRVNLSGTNATDKILPKWMVLEKLELLQVVGSKVTREGMDKAEEELKTSKRKLKIEW